jgi:hypothetical protein
MLLRLQVMLPSMQRGDSCVDGLGKTQTNGCVGVLRGVVGPVREDDVMEVGIEVAVAGAAAKHRPPHVSVGVDKTRHHDAVGAVDHLRASGSESVADGSDPVALDEHVALADHPQLVVHRQDASALNECLSVRHRNPLLYSRLLLRMGRLGRALTDPGRNLLLFRPPSLYSPHLAGPRLRRRCTSAMTIAPGGN